MAFVKSHLKAARDCLGKKDYPSAKQEASLVLDYEPENYNALVFLGLASLELGDLDSSEQAYQKAIDLNPKQHLAYQGLSKLYEKSNNVEKYAQSLLQLISLFNTSADAIKCAEALQKLVALYRERGSRIQLISTLSYYLPASPYYPTLSSLPTPDPTNPSATTTFEAQTAVHNGFAILEEIVKLTEAQEEETFRKEVEKRRMRLGAGSPEDIRSEVFREIARSSTLTELYQEILNHPATTDEQRIDVEAKLLRWKEKYLYAIPNDSDSRQLKTSIRGQVEELVDGIVLLNKPDQLGWTLYFENQDCETLEGYDKRQIRHFLGLFPSLSLSNILKGYFALTGQVLSEDAEEQASYVVNDDDPFDTILASRLSKILGPKTILGSRIVAEVYLLQEDYQSAIRISQQSLQLVGKYQIATGKSLPKTRAGVQTILGTSLVHYFPPKHHVQAATILDEVLGFSAQNSRALMARGFIHEASKQWEDGRSAFDAVARILGDVNQGQALRAQEESAWCLAQLGNVEEALASLRHIQDVLDGINDERKQTDRARCLWRMGQLYATLGGDQIKEAYKAYVSSLKHDSTFAPAFTSLGVYYLENISPPDSVRSSKCFQKAFELDARETVAARRLAEGFANEREWDLVDVVAQRTIDGEGGLDAGLDKKELDSSTRYIPTNAWAWKALGVVRFHHKDYPAAIQALQVALRVHPEDQDMWVRLGDAYNKAGRHAAALKALARAHELNPDDWVCSYFTAEVKHRMGSLSEAIDILRRIQEHRPEEPSALALLIQTLYDLGKSELADGFQVRAEDSFVDAVNVSLEMIDRVAGFRTVAWKVIADAVFALSSFSTFNKPENVRHVLSRIPYLPPPEGVDAVLTALPKPSFPSDGANAALTGTAILPAVVYANLSQIALHSINKTANSSGWYDLAVSLYAWASRQPATVDTKLIKDLVVEYLKKALRINPETEQYWVALAGVYFVSAAQGAQHAYIKALEIDGKNARTWAGLGLLYLYHGDVDLANETFYRAQVLDPDNALAWLGQFLAATANDDIQAATCLVQHAVTLPNPVAYADYEFAFQEFLNGKRQQGAIRLDDILPAFFSLQRYCQSKPEDPSALHLLALTSEKLGHFQEAQALVEKAISVLEATYEETEDPGTEARYTVANATLGRIRLSMGKFTECVESFEVVTGLLGDKDDSVSKDLRAQAFLGIGLAYFNLGDLEASLKALEEGVACAGENAQLSGQLVIVLAQVLWEIGTDETKEVAKTRLLECIASDPQNLMAVNTLAGMGILTTDDTLIDAALAEILALPIDQKRALDPRGQVDYLLVQHYLSQAEVSKAHSVAQHALHADPGSLDQRNKLASLSMQEGRPEEALALLTRVDTGPQLASSAFGDIETGGGGATKPSSAVSSVIRTLCIQAVAECSAGGTRAELGNALRKAQRAIALRPSDLRGWRTLTYLRSMENKG